MKLIPRIRSFAVAVLLALTTLISREGKAQTFALKSNLLYDVLTDASLGAELGLAPRWSAELAVDFRLWRITDNHYAKHIALLPGVRYWFCDRFTGTFMGLHLIGDKFNYSDNTPMARLTLDSRGGRSQGYAAGAGISVGRTWLLTRRLSLEAEAGAGYVASKYDRYDCGACARLTDEGVTIGYIGPTKVAVNLVYNF